MLTSIEYIQGFHFRASMDIEVCLPTVPSMMSPYDAWLCWEGFTIVPHYICVLSLDFSFWSDFEVPEGQSTGTKTNV